MANPLESWKEITIEYDLKEFLNPIKKRISEISQQKKKIFPHKENIFKAFELTPFEKVKVIILGQDPYHGINQANGLAFSVNKDIRFPRKSNIFVN